MAIFDLKKHQYINIEVPKWVKFQNKIDQIWDQGGSKNGPTRQKRGPP